MTDKIVYDRYKHMGLPKDFAVAMAGGTGSDLLADALSTILALSAANQDLQDQIDALDARITVLEGP